MNSRTGRAGLVFPVGRLLRWAKVYVVGAEGVEEDVGIVFAAALETVTLAILTSAVSCMEESGEDQLKGNHIHRAFAEDAVLETFGPAVKDEFNLASYVFKVWRSVNPDAGMAADAMTIVQNAIAGILLRLYTQCKSLLTLNGDKTLTTQHARAAVSLELHEGTPLARKAEEQATLAIDRANESRN